MLGEKGTPWEVGKKEAEASRHDASPPRAPPPQAQSHGSQKAPLLILLADLLLRTGLGRQRLRQGLHGRRRSRSLLLRRRRALGIEAAAAGEVDAGAAAAGAGGGGGGGRAERRRRRQPLRRRHARQAGLRPLEPPRRAPPRPRLFLLLRPLPHLALDPRQRVAAAALGLVVGGGGRRGGGGGWGGGVRGRRDACWLRRRGGAAVQCHALAGRGGVGSAARDHGAAAALGRRVLAHARLRRQDVRLRAVLVVLCAREPVPLLLLRRLRVRELAVARWQWCVR